MKIHRTFTTENAKRVWNENENLQWLYWSCMRKIL